MWYVIQTVTGKEEILVQLIQNIVPRDLYEECFVAYYERIWRRQQQNIIHTERLFPGYVFITTRMPEALFMQLKSVPAMSKLITDDECTCLALEPEEETFFQTMLKDDHIVRLSHVKTDGQGTVLSMSEPLKTYASRIVRFQFKKRYAIIRLEMMGIEKTVTLGIFLDGDVLQNDTLD